MSILRVAIVSVAALVLEQSVGAAPSASSPTTPAPSSAPAPAVPGQFNARVHVENGHEYPYQLLVPKDYDSAKSWPLIVWLHGSGENGNDNKKQLKGVDRTFLADGAKTPAFVLLPQCPTQMAWHATGLNKAPEITESTLALVATIVGLQKEFKLDDRRIYVGGFSMGGCGVWELMTRYPNLFAAAFPVCGGIGNRPEMAPLVKHIPVWAFHYEKDPTGSNVGDKLAFETLKKAGAELKYTEYPGTGHEFMKALSEPQLLPWVFDKKRKDPADFAPAKVPDGALMILKTLAHGTHDMWTGDVQHTGHGVPRIAIDGVRYRLRPADKAGPEVAAFLAKIGKGEITGSCEVTGTVQLEEMAWLSVEKIDSKK